VFLLGAQASCYLSRNRNGGLSIPHGSRDLVPCASFFDDARRLTPVRHHRVTFPECLSQVSTVSWSRPDSAGTALTLPWHGATQSKAAMLHTPLEMCRAGMARENVPLNTAQHHPHRLCCSLRRFSVSTPLTSLGLLSPLASVPERSFAVVQAHRCLCPVPTKRFSGSSDKKTAARNEAAFPSTAFLPFLLDHYNTFFYSSFSNHRHQ
jgi:hypothetical protein